MFGGAAASGGREAARGAFAEVLGAIGDNDLTTTNRNELKSALEDLLGTEVVGFDVSGGGIAVQVAGEAGPMSLNDIALAAGLDVEALAGLEANAGISSEVEGLFAQLLDLLTGLGETLKAGAVPEAAMLDELDTTLDALAAALDMPMPVSPSPAVLAEIGARQLAEGASLSEKLQGTLADIANLLSSLGGDGEAGAVGEKLGTFLTALAETEEAKGLLAKLGLVAPVDGDALDPAIEAKIAALLAVKPDVSAPSIQQASVAPISTDPRLTASVTEGNVGSPTDGEDETGLRLSDIGRERRAENDNRNTERPAANLIAAVARAGEAISDGSAASAAVQAGTRIEIAPGAKPVVAGYQTSQQQLNLPQIAFELVRQVNFGNSQFQMRLDPPELGRIDVKMDIDQAGNITARLTVEKAETLDLMQRDQRALERALAQAGLDGAKTNLEFSLKQQNSGRDQQGDGRLPVFGDDGAGEAETPPPTINLYRGSLTARGVNIFA